MDAANPTDGLSPSPTPPPQMIESIVSSENPTATSVSRTENIESEEDTMTTGDFEKLNLNRSEVSGQPQSEQPTVSEQPSVSEPKDRKNRTQSESYKEFETFEDGKRRTVRTSFTERKEISHKVQRSVYGDASDATTSLGQKEFTELPRIRPRLIDMTRPGSKDSDERLPRTAVINVKPTDSAAYQERVIDTMPRSTPAGDVREIPTNRIGSVRSRIAVPANSVVSAQLHENMKKQYELEIAYWKNLSAGSEPLGEDQTSRDMLHRRIIMLESDLRDSKNVSEMVSDDLQNLRKQYEYVVNRTLQLESINRSLQDKIREYKSTHKKMIRDLQDKETLMEKLREAHSREKRNQLVRAEMEEEYSRLARDYEILRQTYNRKEQQIHGFFTERAELYRKLDELDYDKQQLETQLSTRSKRSARSSRMSEGRIPSYRYGHLPRTLQMEEQRHEDDTYALNTEISSQINPPQSKSATLPGWKFETKEETQPKPDEGPNPVQQTGGLDPSGVNTEQTLTPNDHNTEQLNVDTAKPSVEEIIPTTADGVEQQKPKEKTNGLNISPGVASEPHLPSAPYYKHPVLERRSGTDSPDDELYGYPGPLPPRQTRDFEETSIRHHRSVVLRRSNVRKRVDADSPYPLDSHTDSYRRLSRQRRPSSAYGYSYPLVGDFEIYRNPLPPRSTTSIGRLPSTDYLLRSPDREYSRSQRSPVRRWHLKYPDTPDPFKYELKRPSRLELAHMEDELNRLRREKRHLEKQYYSTHSVRYNTHSYSRHDELWESLTRISQDIRDLQARITAAKNA
ncbi:hypothetical protein P879_01576 [Paragonimus westermani]|uniref:Uncharacterized protein n=1 Tax=Paragonimus westermani TaxID=34504 RepID=A0A8T0DKB2_9TREM|nr:hypothetical protein P879_01576 [Paragonimus westermani]